MKYYINATSLFKNILCLFPFLNWPRPTLNSLKRDAWAGITVGLVLVPQAVAYATLAGMPPQTGLYAALLPSIVGLLWGATPLLAVGPVALTSLLVFGTLAPMAKAGSDEWVSLAIWLSLYSGLIQLVLGLFRQGRIANLVSQPVIVGFINAAAVIIIISQLPALFGVSLSSFLSVENISGLFSGILYAPITIGFGGATVLFLLCLKYFFPKFPGILIVTVIGIILSIVFDYSGHGGEVVGFIPAGLGGLSLPSMISFEQHRQLWLGALILALISFTEAMSSCRMLARKNKEQWNENQELIGQGLAKVTSAISGAFPVSGSFSRTALNLYVGASSAWSTLFAALCVLLSLLFLTPYLQYLPRSVLAAVIIVPVFSLIDYKSIRRLFAISKMDGVIAVVTLLITLMTAPQLYWGIAIGVAITITYFLYRHAQPRVIEVGLHSDGTLRDRSRFDLPRFVPNILAVRLDSGLDFLSSVALERFINTHCRQDKTIRCVLFCAGSVNNIDASGVETLESIHATLRNEGIDFYICTIKKQVLDVLDRTGFLNTIGTENIFNTDLLAFHALQKYAELYVD